MSTALSFNPLRSRRRRSGFTILELLVVAGVILVLLCIFIPYLVNVREMARRTRCNDNLRKISWALNKYASSNSGAFPRVRYDREHKPLGYVAFTGADSSDPFGRGVRANDVTASLWLLLREEYVTDPAVFVCPSGDERPDDISAGVRGRSNFRSGRNLSYSFASTFSTVEYADRAEYRLPQFVVMADRNPGIGPESDVTGPRYSAPRLEFARANSPNHGRAGQNVLYVSGTAEWTTKPYVGVEADNIYTAQQAEPYSTTKPAKPDWRGVLGRNYGPASIHDSYLVPTAQENSEADFPLPPPSRPAATTTVSVPPATTQAVPATTRAVEPATTTAPSTQNAP